MGRKLQPKSDHLLYFPQSKKVVIGQHEWVWLWQNYDFHQVELGYFHVIVEYGSSKSLEPARSADGLMFTIRVVFEVAVKPDSDALEKATQRRTPSRDIKMAIGHRDFADWLQGSLRRVVADALSKREYFSSDVVHFRQSLDKEIDNAARLALRDEGFELFRCDVLEVTPEPPSNHTLAQNPTLREKWNAYSDVLIKIEEEGKIREENKVAEEKERERRLQEQEDNRNSEAEIRRKELLNKRDEQIAALVDANERKKLEREEALEERRLENSKATEAIKQQHIMAKRQTEAVDAQEKARVEQMKLELLEAESRAKHTSELEHLKAECLRLDQELKLMELRLQSAEGQTKLVSQKAKEVEIVGQAEATVTRAKALAENAQLLESNRELLESLPKVLETAGKSIPQPAEMKVMYVTGQPGSGSSAENNVGSLFATASSFSLLREIIKFIGDWNEYDISAKTVSRGPIQKTAEQNEHPLSS